MVSQSFGACADGRLACVALGIADEVLSSSDAMEISLGPMFLPWVCPLSMGIADDSASPLCCLIVPSPRLSAWDSGGSGRARYTATVCSRSSSCKQGSQAELTSSISAEAQLVPSFMWAIRNRHEGAADQQYPVAYRQMRRPSVQHRRQLLRVHLCVSPRPNSEADCQGRTEDLDDHMSHRHQLSTRTPPDCRGRETRCRCHLRSDE